VKASDHTSDIEVFLVMYRVVESWSFNLRNFTEQGGREGDRNTNREGRVWNKTKLKTLMSINARIRYWFGV
jgi:hypothetical protein